MDKEVQEPTKREWASEAERQREKERERQTDRKETKLRKR